MEINKSIIEAKSIKDLAEKIRNEIVKCVSDLSDVKLEDKTFTDYVRPFIGYDFLEATNEVLSIRNSVQKGKYLKINNNCFVFVEFSWSASGNILTMYIRVDKKKEFVSVFYCNKKGI